MYYTTRRYEYIYRRFPAKIRISYYMYGFLSGSSCYIYAFALRFSGFLNLYLTIIPSLQVLTTNMWLNLNWMDTQLTWNAVSKRIA